VTEIITNLVTESLKNYMGKCWIEYWKHDSIESNI
jgi:hypothetical protein